MSRLLTIGEVSDILRTSERKVRDLAIPVVRIGRKRLYDPRDVDEYVKGQKQCLSSKDPVAAIGKRSLSARASGLAEALARHPAVQPKPSNASLETRLPRKPGRSSSGPNRAHLMKLVDATGSSTDRD